MKEAGHDVAVSSSMTGRKTPGGMHLFRRPNSALLPADGVIILACFLILVLLSAIKQLSNSGGQALRMPLF